MISVDAYSFFAFSDLSNTVKCNVQISTHNASQLFGQFGQMVECSFIN